jgi:methylglutaconyl-CoA hydratase
MRIVEALLAGGPEALRAAKRLVLDAPLSGEETAGRLAARRVSREGQEGLAAFFEKRPPAWGAGSS